LASVPGGKQSRLRAGYGPSLAAREHLDGAVGSTGAMSPSAQTGATNFPRAADYDSERGWRAGTAWICFARFRQAV